ncbi:glycosyltransferase [Microbacterium sp. No. 7]|uniref:glycosyltransferase n=1 Tax=Microbacterium sp. No. 7 TaxID=1714373 RepID=UPI0006ED0DDE|nr:glycosyltransferase [Microbacterium sp. No. 7]ALJ19053.1 glycosyl transferase family 1 [Microbacterium sp. No. 7]
MTPPPLVAVFRSGLLAGSETFVRTQGDTLPTWRSVFVGFERIESPLARDTDVILYRSAGGRARVRAAKLFARSGTLRRYLTSARPDVLHAHFGFDGAVVRSAARRANIPLIVTLHGADATADAQAGGWRGPLYRRRLRRLFADAAVVIAVSQAIAERALSLGAPAEKTVVHYIGIPSESVGAAPEVSIRSGVLFVGRLTEKKGLDDLIAAYAGLPPELRERQPLTVIGDGPKDLDYRALAQQATVDVNFLGAQPPSEVIAAMRACAVFCAPSKTAANGDTEGLPIVVLEAAREGAPIVATRHSGIPEAVVDGQTGVLVDEGDVEALRRALESMLTDRARAETMARAGRAWVISEFNTAKQSEKLERLYVRARERRA